MNEYYIDESGFLTKTPPVTPRPTYSVSGRGKSRRPYKMCPICSQQTRRLDKHLSKIHPGYKDTIDDSKADKDAAHLIHQRSPDKESRATTKKSVSTPQNMGKVITQCPYCKNSVRSDRLEKHISKKCSTKRKSEFQVNKPKSLQTKSGTQPKGISGIGPVISKASIDEEALRQSFDEPIDGGKYLGQMRREWDGKFGSLPLYDDYEDEADAN